MAELYSSPFFGLALSAALYIIGVYVQKNTKLKFIPPLITAMFLLAVILIGLHIPFEDFYVGGSIINMLLTPTTACLAISIYNQRKILKENLIPIIVGCTSGALASMVSIVIMCRLFGLNREMLISLLPKSVTTAISTAICETNGGIVSITVLAVIFTGNIGMAMVPFLMKLFRVTDPIEAGIAIGTCSHAIGTSRAITMGETEGATSGLAIGIAGVATVILSIFFYAFI